MKTRIALAAVAAIILSAMPAIGQDNCGNRGQLDTMYCDENNDLVADAPGNVAKQKDPPTLVFSYSPVEDPAVYQKLFKPFTDHLGQCVGKRVVYSPVQSNSAEIEAMRSGRLHIAGFSTGPTVFAVNLAGAVPFAAKGTVGAMRGYNLISVVKQESSYQQLADLKGKRVAHTAPASNSGHLAPLVLYPPEGLQPYSDYQPLMSGGHDKSVLGVAAGDYDMAGVASDVFDRMMIRGSLKRGDFRIIYKSRIFPTSSFAYAHDLKPELAQKIMDCFFTFRFTAGMTKEFNGDDRFVPINYQKDWAVVLDVAEKSGVPYSRNAYDAEAKREAETATRKAAEEGAKQRQDARQ